MSQNVYIDPRFAKPTNVIGLEDPEEGVTSGGIGGAAGLGLPDGTGTGSGGTGNTGGSGGEAAPSFAAPTFTISSQELVLDSFGNYRVNAILSINNAIEGATYEVRFSDR